MGRNTQDKLELMSPVFMNTCVKLCEEESWQLDDNDLGEVVKKLESMGWELLIDNHDMKVLQRPVKRGSPVCAYKVVGHFSDISANQFRFAQMNLAYRKQWDGNVCELKVLDKKHNDEEIVFWEHKYPYPFASRRYIYVRSERTKDDEGLVWYVAKAIDPLSVGRKDIFLNDGLDIFVDDFHSEMILKADSDIKKPGFRYMINYVDNPKINAPAFAYKWIARNGFTWPYRFRGFHKQNENGSKEC